MSYSVINQIIKEIREDRKKLINKEKSVGVTEYEVIQQRKLDDIEKYLVKKVREKQKEYLKRKINEETERILEEKLNKKIEKENQKQNKNQNENKD